MAAPLYFYHNHGLPDFQSDELGLKPVCLIMLISAWVSSRFPVRRIRIETIGIVLQIPSGKQLPDFQSDELGLKRDFIAQKHVVFTLPDFQSDELGLKRMLPSAAPLMSISSRFPVRRIRIETKPRPLEKSRGGASRFPVRRIRIETNQNPHKNESDNPFPISSQTN